MTPPPTCPHCSGSLSGLHSADHCRERLRAQLKTAAALLDAFAARPCPQTNTGVPCGDCYTCQARATMAEVRE